MRKYLAAFLYFYLKSNKYDPLKIPRLSTIGYYSQAVAKDVILQSSKLLCSYVILFIWGAQWLSGRVLDSRPRGRGFEPHRRHCVVSLSKNINPSLILVQPRKTRPFITERLLMGRKESNQTNKTSSYSELNIAQDYWFVFLRDGYAIKKK